eukprot:gnl/MRDRNA2_/MRDRNA2_117938_c0_seq1.p1 gnl/MRDRNA2_/MRDRNA2_117938_c0~~gnl/MRDRNA2_/MRDRNA2_117938_c0_seq1.p1  ORF type:complete len:164 (+),score=56.08 gnl/MRDRNA2_/MRDRNA2_117938_c0_seq1:1-492(+)
MMQMMKMMMGGGMQGGGWPKKKGVKKAVKQDVKKEPGQPQEQGAKNKLMHGVQLIITKNHQRNINPKSDFEWDVQKVDNGGTEGYQATVTITDSIGPEGGKCFTGEVCSDKKEAENSVCKIAYEDMKDMFEQLDEENKAKKKQKEQEKWDARKSKKIASGEWS